MDRKLDAEANVVVGGAVANEDGVNDGMNEGTGFLRGDSVGNPRGFTHLLLGMH